jgi:hypothetical protein
MVARPRSAPTRESGGSLTPKRAQILMQRALDAAREVLATEGVDITAEVRACHPRDVEVGLFLRLPEPDDAKRRFLEHAPVFGLDARHYLCEFAWQGATWRLVGLNPNAPKNPIEAIRLPSGASRRLPLDALWFCRSAGR